MKNLILVALILQLVIIIISAKPAAGPKNYKFGDIIKFPRTCIGSKALYNHYAVYVGPETGVNVGQGQNDIVHRSGTFNKYNCKFDQLARVRGKYTERVYNYLDDVEKDKGVWYTPGTTEEIKARITYLVDMCTQYKLFSNNCEHFATEVRYNVAMTMQVGALTQCVVVKSDKAKALLAIIRKDQEDEDKCEKNR